MTNNISILHEGNQIVLPVTNGIPMPYDTAIEWLKRKKIEDEQKVGIYHEFECSPLDGLVAFQKALAQKYGWTALVPTPGFFGDKPPSMIGVPIGENETIHAPSGRVEIPGITGYLEPRLGKTTFTIAGEVRQKHKDDINAIVTLVKQILEKDSIYKGKAIKISFDWKRKEIEGIGQYHAINDAPKFMHLNGIKDDDLIFGEKVLGDINIGLFTPIEQTAACRKFGVPLKRGVLLYGPYGTGKTMTAYVTALKAIRNGWTFIYLDSVTDLKEGLEFAAKYAPAVIFAEDIDRAANGERSIKMDDILNTLDGVDTKGAEIITVLTTNHIEEINPAILRMGRLDTLVEVLPPDADAAIRLVKLYARGLLAQDVDLQKIGKALSGRIPAFIREVTERAKIAAISRLNGENIEGQVLETDLLKAAHAMETHASFLEPKKVESSKAEMLVKIPAGHKDTKTIMSLVANN